MTKIKNMVTFFNDQDGFSAKDFLMMITVGIFSLTFITGLVLIVIGRDLNQDFFDLMEVGRPIFITVIAAIMGTQCVEVVGNVVTDRAKNKKPQFEQEDIV